METRNTPLRNDGAVLSGATLFPSEDVINATDLSVEEKRAVLGSWASDAYVVESTHALRMVPGVPEPIPCDDVLSALNAGRHKGSSAAVGG